MVTGHMIKRRHFYKKSKQSNRITVPMLSFLRAELYWSSDRKCSLDISNGDFAAISHTPSYHSLGHKAEKVTNY